MIDQMAIVSTRISLRDVLVVRPSIASTSRIVPADERRVHRSLRQSIRYKAPIPSTRARFRRRGRLTTGDHGVDPLDRRHNPVGIVAPIGGLGSLGSLRCKASDLPSIESLR